MTTQRIDGPERAARKRVPGKYGCTLGYRTLLPGHKVFGSVRIRNKPARIIPQPGPG